MASKPFNKYQELYPIDSLLCYAVCMQYDSLSKRLEVSPRSNIPFILLKCFLFVVVLY